jgi:hypothetical protein
MTYTEEEDYSTTKLKSNTKRKMGKKERDWSK